MNIPMVNHCRHGSTFTGTGSAGQQNQASLPEDMFAKQFWQTKFSQCGNMSVNPANNHPRLAALEKGTDPEPAGAIMFKGVVAFHTLAELLITAFTHHCLQCFADMVWLQLSVADRSQLFVDFQAGRKPDSHNNSEPLRSASSFRALLISIFNLCAGGME